MPDMIDAAARLTAVMPEPQKRSSVMPLALDVVAGIERRHAAEIAALLAALRDWCPR